MGDSGILPYPEVSEFLAARETSKINGHAHQDKLIVFITDEACPFVFDYGRRAVKTFTMKGKKGQAPLCVAISADSKYVATGGVDGSVSLWSLESMQLLKTHQKVHKDPVVGLSFGETSDILYAADCSGLVTVSSITKLFSVVSLSEKIFYRNAEPISKLMSTKGSSPFFALIVLAKTSFCILDPARFKAGQSPLARASETYDDGVEVSLRRRDSAYLMLITSGTRVCLMQLVAPDNYYQLNNLEEKDGRIAASGFLNQNCFALVLSNQTIKLINSEGRCIAKEASKMVEELLMGHSFMFCFEEMIMLVGNGGLNSISFLPWDQTLAKQNGLDTFPTLTEIYLGINQDLIGLESNLTKRRLLVQEFARTTFRKLVSGTLTAELLEAVVNEAFLLDMNDYALGEAYKLCKKNGMLKEYFGAALPQYIQKKMICHPEFLEHYLEYAPEDENTLMKMYYFDTSVLKLLKHAIEHKLFGLVTYLTKEYFSNPRIAAQFHYEQGKLKEFFKNEALLSDHLLLLWLFEPESGRLQSILKDNWSFALTLFNAVKKQLPIDIPGHGSLHGNNLVSMYSKAMSIELYSDIKALISPIVEYILSNELEVPSKLLKHFITHCFTEKEIDEHSKLILERIVESYGEYLPTHDIGAFAESRGLSSLAIKCYLNLKLYTKILGTMILDPEQEEQIFLFIRQHSDDAEEMKEAIGKHLASLVLIDGRQTVDIIDEFYPELHESLTKLSIAPNIKYIYLSKLLSGNHEDLFQGELFLEYFELTCQYEPQSSLTYLTEVPFIENPLEALPICDKYGLFDCAAFLHKIVGNIKEAFDLLGKEVERTVLEYIMSSSTEVISSVDQLPDCKDIAEAFDAVNKTIKLTSDANAPLELWESMFKIFRFPLYLCRNKAENIRQGVLLLFVYFVVEVLDCTDAEFVIKCLNLHFTGLSSKQYSKLLTNVFGRLDYQLMLNNTLEQLLIGDCLKLIHDAYIKTTKGVISESSTLCGACQERLSRGVNDVIMFPCGHCFHKSMECGDYDACPFCSGSGETKVTAEKQQEHRIQHISQRRLQQLMRKFEYSLKRNYTSDSSEHGIAKSAFMASRSINDSGLAFDLHPTEELQQFFDIESVF